MFALLQAQRAFEFVGDAGLHERVFQIANVRVTVGDETFEMLRVRLLAFDILCRTGHCAAQGGGSSRERAGNFSNACINASVRLLHVCSCRYASICVRSIGVRAARSMVSINSSVSRVKYTCGISVNCSRLVETTGL